MFPKSKAIVGIAGLSFCLLYIACIVLVGGYFATNFSSQIVMGLTCGAPLVIPIFILVTLIQGLIYFAFRRFSEKRSAPAFGVLISPSALILILAFFYKSAVMDPKIQKSFFSYFFKDPPAATKLITYAYERNVFGGGAYVMVFRISEGDMKTLMNNEGFASVDIEVESNRRDLSLCNSVIGRIASADYKIDQSFACYSKKSETNSAHVFYQASQNVGVFVGFGRYILPNFLAFR